MKNKGKFFTCRHWELIKIRFRKSVAVSLSLVFVLSMFTPVQVFGGQFIMGETNNNRFILNPGPIAISDNRWSEGWGHNWVHGREFTVVAGTELIHEATEPEAILEFWELSRGSWTTHPDSLLEWIISSNDRRSIVFNSPGRFYVHSGKSSHFIINVVDTAYAERYTRPFIPQPISFVGAVRLIREHGFLLYTANINGRSYHVYRVNGRVVAGETGFEFQNWLTTHYLICAATDTLVEDPNTLRRAGFLHRGNTPNMETIARNEVMSRIDSVRSMANYYYYGATRLIRTQRNDAALRFGISFMGAVATGGKLSLLQSGIFTGKEILNYVGMDMITGALGMTKTIDTLDELQRGRNLSLQEYNRANGNVVRLFNEQGAFHNGFMASYELASYSSYARALYSNLSLYHDITMKYFAHEISRGIFSMSLNSAFTAMGVTASQFLDSSNILGEVTVKLMDATASGVKVLVSADTTQDRDLQHLETETRRNFERHVQSISNPNNLTLMGNILLLRSAWDVQSRFDQAVVIKCPVEISVYSPDGYLIGNVRESVHYASGVSIFSPGLNTRYPFIITAVDGARILMFSSENDYRIEITATDMGTMTFYEFQVDEDGDVITSTFVNDISLETGMNFTVNPGSGSPDYGVMFLDNGIFITPRDRQVNAHFTTSLAQYDPRDIVRENQEGQPLLRFVIGQLQYTHQGIMHISDAAPFIADNRTLVPLRIIAEALDTVVGWDGYTSTATIAQGETVLSLTIDQPLPDGMGTPMIVDGRTLVPARYVSEMLGAPVRWDGESFAVYIYFNS